MKDYRNNHSKIRITPLVTGAWVLHFTEKAMQASKEKLDSLMLSHNTLEKKEESKNRFTVKLVQWTMEKFDNQDTPTRKIVELGKDLTWQKAKKMTSENKGSWIIPQDSRNKKELQADETFSIGKNTLRLNDLIERNKREGKNNLIVNRSKVRKEVADFASKNIKVEEKEINRRQVYVFSW